MSEDNPLIELITQFGKLPGLGDKSAERIAFHLLKSTKENIESLCKAIQSIKDIQHCSICFNFAVTTKHCSICSSPYRDKSVICVVEEISDLWAVEQTGAYKGLYHVLKGRISPLDKIGPENLTIKQLLDRLNDGKIKEIILATSHTLEGDATAVYLQDRLSELKIKVSRLARGIPAGSKIETASRPMLADALRERNIFNPNFFVNNCEK